MISTKKITLKFRITMKDEPKAFFAINQDEAKTIILLNEQNQTKTKTRKTGKLEKLSITRNPDKRGCNGFND